ncbi:outer membrane protein assembly factor BamB family protein [Streptomyces sp. 4N509B]|uniref:outer membrane protein assembly factor BamB family protein n=1 Tax=Streptomyces sp. 4N509B TaxID=3457413 RepID=UPI003FD44200
MPLVSGAALLALLTAALVVWAGGGDEGPTEAWRVADDGTHAVGDVDAAVWAHGAVVTRVGPSRVTGHDAADGRTLWEAEPPADAGRACAASEHTNADGVGAVLFTIPDAEGDGDCVLLALVDTGDGTLLWSRRLDTSMVVRGEEVVATVSERTVLVSLGSVADPGNVHRLDLATGEERPAPPLQAPRCPDEPLTMATSHAGSRFAVVTACVGDDGYEHHTLSVYDADTSEPLLPHPLGGMDASAHLVSANPLVVATGEELVAFSDSGERQWRIRAHDEATGLPLLRIRAVVGGVLVTEALTADGAPRAVFTGHDLRGGERLWRTRLPEDTTVLGVDDGRDGAGTAVLLGRYRYDHDEERMHLTWLDPANGADRAAGSVPFTLQDSTVGAVVAFDADRFYLSGSVERELRLRAFDR